MSREVFSSSRNPTDLAVPIEKGAAQASPPRMERITAAKTSAENPPEVISMKV